MKTEKRIWKRILQIIILVVIWCSFPILSQAATEVVSEVNAWRGPGYEFKEDYNNNLMGKWYSGNDKIHLKYVSNATDVWKVIKGEGDQTLITTESLVLPYVYCTQFIQNLGWARYDIYKETVNDNSYLAYLLATKSDTNNYVSPSKPRPDKDLRGYDIRWYNIDKVQLAIWLSDRNSGHKNEEDIKKRIVDLLSKELPDEWGKLSEQEAKEKAQDYIDEARKLLNTAYQFEAWRNSYKAPEKNNTNPQLKENNIIGPFNITFSERKYEDVAFGGWADSKKTKGTPFTLRAKNANGQTVQLSNDGADWIFCDANGNNIGRPTSGKDFYIKIKNQNIVEAVDLQLNFFRTDAKAKAYKLWGYLVNDTRPQELIVVDNGKITQVDAGLNIQINQALNIKLAGRVFLDNPTGKGENVNGIKDNYDTMLSGITVNLRKYSDKSIVATTTTNKDGYYEFRVKPDTYYVEFIYDGQNYEPTTYNMQKKEIADGVWNKTGIPERSYATDGEQNRDTFNKVYAEITGDVDRTRYISAYTGKNGMQELKTYGIKNTEEERTNINLGLMDREKVNLILSKDLWEVRLSINGFPEKYIYNDRDGEDMTIQLRGTDVTQYERAVRKTDVPYVDGVEVTYRIRLYNASANIDTEISRLVDWYDSTYQMKRLYKDDGTEITYTEEKGNDYNKITTTNYSSGTFTLGESRYVYADYTIDPKAVEGLINGEEILENYAEIGGYKTFYHEKRVDLNNDIVMHKAGEIAGLVDINSEPNNFDPNREEVDRFVHVESKTEEYKNLSGEEKAERSFKIFQDDADVAPGLKFTLSNDERKILGNVWDDHAELQDDNTRLGDGIFTEEEKLVDGQPAIKGVKVELRDAKTDEIVKETRTEDDGTYTLSGFIPGEYYIKFTYGDEDALKEHNARYNGQDYKATLYDLNKYTDPYWYAKDGDKRYSDASDNMDRRQIVNDYSRKMTNYKATLLKTKEDIKELAEKTYMTSRTKGMTMEVEYVTQETPYDPEKNLPKYEVKDIDFGLAERARSQLAVEKRVSNVKIITHDGQDVLPVTDKQGHNLAWIPNDQIKNENRRQGYIQATVDNSLISTGSIYIDYTVTLKNTGEVNYVVNKSGDTSSIPEANEDIEFYLTGKPSKDAVIVQAQADYIVDYINNNMLFDLSMNKDEAGNDLWNVDSSNELFKENVEETIINNSLKNQITTNYQTIIKASNTNPLVTTSLEPGNSVSTTIHLYQKGLSPEGQDTLQYDNSLEIVRLTEQTGRRQQLSIVGNFDPTAKIEMATLEPDSSVAETVTVLPPFGNSHLYYLIGAIVIVSVLGVGVFLIIRKVMPRNK